MKQLIRDNLPSLLFIFFSTCLLYYFVTTRGIFIVPHDLDYFNPLAHAFLTGRLDIFPKPGVVSDLSIFHGKWYPYWGPLPAFFIMPLQVLLGRYFPLAYLSILFAGVNMSVVYLILRRLKKDYFPAALSQTTCLLLVAFIAFGTSHLFIATRSGTWFVAQTVSFLPCALGLLILLRKKLQTKDYFWASLFISLSLLGRYSLILGLAFLVLRLLDELLFQKVGWREVRNKLAVSALPFFFCFSFFCLYNFLRFGNPFDFGFAYTVFDYYFFPTLAKYGPYSWYYAPMNFWRMLFELPQVTWKSGVLKIMADPNGFSVFAASPLFLVAFNTIDKNLFALSEFSSRIKLYLWLLVILQIVALVPLMTMGLNQFGLRYATDIALPLLCLVVFALKGKLNILALGAVLVSILLNLYGIFVFV